jgi:hypothetical protein
MAKAKTDKTAPAKPETREYTVRALTRLDGRTCAPGETMTLHPRKARYLVLTGQIAEA